MEYPLTRAKYDDESIRASKRFKVDTIIPEPLFSRSLSTTRWVKKNKELDRIILCSFQQLDLNKEQELIEELAEIEIHFCLEDLSGKGRAFLTQLFQELKLFKNTQNIAYDSVKSYQDLQDILKS